MKNWKLGKGSAALFLGLSALVTAQLNGQTAKPQTAKQYEPTIASLDTHPLPAWYADAKLGIFIHWGLYSVPGWAPLVHPSHDFSTEDYLKNNPYAEWYYNTVRIPGSPTQAYNKQHYGADHNYYSFAKDFDRESMQWNPNTWAKVFKDAGAKYVVLTTKHHEGFTLWPSAIHNPTLPADEQHATRDIVGELTASVRKTGMRMGLYYSGGFDWTFVHGPITNKVDFEKTKPESQAYGDYAYAQAHELIQRYHPAVLWNDIDWPRTGQPLKLMAYYYNTVPDGVLDDRYGVPHSDFVTPEYKTINEISKKKWEECRGLGRSFGYNRAEGEAETIASDKLIYLLVDIVSKNGNLLLDVGPEADGTIPAVQLNRLHALGKWLSQNGEAIYATHPWTHAEGKTAEGIPVRFTQKNNYVYATLLGVPKAGSITLQSLAPKAGTKVTLLGYAKPLQWTQQGNDVKVSLPATLPGQYAYSLRMTAQ